MSTILDALNKAKEERELSGTAEQEERVPVIEEQRVTIVKDRTQPSHPLTRTLIFSVGVLCAVGFLSGAAIYLVISNAQSGSRHPAQSSGFVPSDFSPSPVETPVASQSESRDAQKNKIPGTRKASSDKTMPPEQLLVINIAPTAAAPEKSIAPSPISQPEAAKPVHSPPPVGQSESQLVKQDTQPQKDEEKPSQPKIINGATIGIKLGGIVYDKHSALAMINGEILGEGDTIGNLKVVQIERTKVHLQNEKGEKIIVKY